MSGIELEIAALYPWIVGVACRMAGDEADGEDLAHDTIIKAIAATKKCLSSPESSLLTSISYPRSVPMLYPKTA